MIDYEKLWERIPKGQENAVDVSTLANILNMSARNARRAIKKMLRKKKLVCNVRHGYFAPNTIEEAVGYKNMMHSYSNELQSDLYYIKEVIKKMERGTYEY